MKTNRLFCLIELAAVAALYFFENNSGTRAALAVSALVPLLSVLCAYRCSRKAALSLDVPGTAKRARRSSAACARRRSVCARGAPSCACKTPSRGRKRAPPPSWGKPFPCPSRTAAC
ncbi:MAG: hypothetical protein ACLS6G_09925 [Christensenellales bacterium]